MLFDVNWLVYSSLSAHMEKEESKVNIAGIAQHGTHSIFGLVLCCQSFLIQKLPLSLSLNFIALIEVVFCFVAVQLL